jgi:DUF1365 family protein
LPLIGFGQVRHTRLRPASNAFAYPTYFLMLPMRSLQDPHRRSPAARWRATGRGAELSRQDHGDGRAPEAGGALAWLDELLQREGITDATRRSLAALLPACAGLHLQAGELLVLPPGRDGGAARHRGGGQQHLWRAPLLPAGRPRYGAELTARKVFHVSPFLRGEGGYRFRFMRTPPTRRR